MAQHRRPSGKRGSAKTAEASGLEKLLAKATGDKRFRERLLSDHEEAVETSRVELTESERVLLTSVSGKQLEQLITNTPRPAAPRRRFVRTAVGWLGALLGGSALLGGCSSPAEEPEPSPIRGSQPDPPAPTGIRPD